MAPRHSLACESVVVAVTSWRYLTGTWSALSPAQEACRVNHLHDLPFHHSSILRNQPTTARRRRRRRANWLRKPLQRRMNPIATSIIYPIPAIENSREYSQGPKKKHNGTTEKRSHRPELPSSGRREHDAPSTPERIPHSPSSVPSVDRLIPASWSTPSRSTRTAQASCASPLDKHMQIWRTRRSVIVGVPKHAVLDEKTQ